MMAAELARRGIAVRCIDKSPGIDPHVRANLLHSRTLEIFLNLGLADQMTEGSIAEEGLFFYRDGELVGKSSSQPTDSPFPFGMSQSQAHVEAVLEQYLRELGVEVERGVALMSLNQDDKGVNVTLQNENGIEETARFQWLVGCDGAHSKVRHLSNCAFPGDADPFPYVLGDVVVEEDLERGHGHVFLHDSGELFLFSTLPGERRLVCANLTAGEVVKGTPSLEELQSIVEERGVPGLRLQDPRWLAYFHISYRLAPHYRQGRIFLAGDAAHIHSLLAGQGMNTGIQDACNLAWKLAMVVRREAPVTLLDSYEMERRPIAESVVKTTREITETMEQYPTLSPEEREKLIIQMFTPEPERLSAARHLQELDLDYGASPLSLEVDGEFSKGPPPGQQCPHVGPLEVNEKSTTLFQLKPNTAYQLFLFQGKSPDVGLGHLQQIAERESARFGKLLDTYVVTAKEIDSANSQNGGHTVIRDRDAIMHEKFGADSPCLYLLRPDGYVAYRSKDLNTVSQYFAHMKISPRSLGVNAPQ